MAPKLAAAVVAHPSTLAYYEGALAAARGVSAVPPSQSVGVERTPWCCRSRNNIISSRGRSRSSRLEEQVQERQRQR